MKEALDERGVLLLEGAICLQKGLHGVLQCLQLLVDRVEIGRRGLLRRERREGRGSSRHHMEV